MPAATLSARRVRCLRSGCDRAAEPAAVPAVHGRSRTHRRGGLPLAARRPAARPARLDRTRTRRRGGDRRQGNAVGAAPRDGLRGARRRRAGVVRGGRRAGRAPPVAMAGPVRRCRTRRVTAPARRRRPARPGGSRPARRSRWSSRVRWRLGVLPEPVGPAFELGLSMAGVHAPVAQLNEQLEAPIDGFFERLTPERSFWRLGWGVLDTPDWYTPLDGTAAPRPVDPAPVELFLRVERETLRRFPFDQLRAVHDPHLRHPDPRDRRRSGGRSPPGRRARLHSPRTSGATRTCDRPRID